MQYLTLAALVLVLVVNCVILSIVFIAFRQFVEIRKQFEIFTTSPGDGKPSPLAEVIQASSEILARSILAQAKTTLMGFKSGMAKAERGIQGDLAEGIAEQAGFGSVLDAIPGARKSLRKNPGLIDIALSFLGNRSNGNHAGAAGSSGDRPRFNL